MASPTSTLSFIRQALLIILLIGVVGTLAELFLLKHTDGFWQLIPVVLNGLILAALCCYAVARNALSIRFIQCVMLLCLASGGVGVVQHYLANIRDTAEGNPGLTKEEVYREAIGGSTPALAPGTMVQLALVGLAFAYRHPALRGGAPQREDES